MPKINRSQIVNVAFVNSFTSESCQIWRYKMHLNFVIQKTSQKVLKIFPRISGGNWIFVYKFVCILSLLTRYLSINRPTWKRASWVTSASYESILIWTEQYLWFSEKLRDRQFHVGKHRSVNRKDWSLTKLYL